MLGPEVTLCIYSEDAERDKDPVKQHYLGDANRKRAIDEFKKEKSESVEEQTKTDNKWRNVEILIVCDMLLTGFDAPIVETMYLDKGLRDHTLLQAIARVNRPYNELKKVGVVIDYFGVFEKLQDALNFDRNELGEVAFPLIRLREQFKVEMQWQLDLFAEFEKKGDRDTIMGILAWLNINEPSREKFELGYRNLSLLWETLHPDPFLVEHEANYLWLSRLWMYYTKEFYPLGVKYETDPADGAKTRELIRQHVDVEELKRNMPVYVLDADYLTKLKDTPPDSKALNIEAMLAAELQLRAGEDPEYEPLSEKLKRIVQEKRNGTMAGLVLLRELEELAKETIALIQEGKRPLAESITRAALERSPGLADEEAARIAVAVLEKADEVVFPGWTDQEHVQVEMFREFTKLLAKQFPAVGLHGRDKDFVDRCIKLLYRANYGGKSNE